ncbi:hypothetical protein B5F40_06105 [Gordonibacter sp. An230]|uniref:hypothetical protein n=1 Tax=Gordonibacter sp. An230 TaxID=1965592 RepID=UPI000B36E51A|nr:hypothetical protein [Gordonibacter sp. An230]OUO90758.1 hypothetical protein B5F40_06105 [Gordonibacter sp. An230]
MLRISTEKLLLVAGLVWLVAGANVAGIGLIAYFHESGWVLWSLVGGTFVVFTLFHVFVFTKMVGKHAERIRGYEEDRTHVLKFFDKKGYVTMAVMMAGGIALRASGVVPEWFVAFFYTGLGAALAVAGASFALRYFRSSKPSCPVMPRDGARRGDGNA